MIEAPLYAAGLRGLFGTSLRWGLVSAVAVNLVSHPLLWLAWDPSGLPWLLVGEVTVCALEVLIVCGALKEARDEPIGVVALAVGANGTSLLAGALVL